MRKKPWQFVEKAILGVGSSEEGNVPRMLVVTGMGGCGKTQLILQFAHENKDQ
jgi:GTPase SAR1 family protein